MVFLVEGTCFSLAVPGTDPDFHPFFFFFRKLGCKFPRILKTRWKATSHLGKFSLI